jgi:hypothetical protein
MNLQHLKQPPKYISRLTYILFIFLINPGMVMSQSTIMKIEVNGFEEQSAILSITKPGGSKQTTIYNRNTSFPAGTTFQTPSNTQLWLTGNQNQQHLPPNTIHIATVSSKGDWHQTLLGKVTHYVRNKLNFYKSSGPDKKVRAHTRSTTFTVEAIGKNVAFNTTEGDLQILQEIPVNITEAPQNIKRKKKRPLSTTISTNQSAGSGVQTFNNNPAPKSYGTYEDALAEFEIQLYQNRQNGAHPEQLADDYSLLGELYLDNGQASKAVFQFENALVYYLKVYDADSSIADAYLNLAEAQVISGDIPNGDDNANYAINLILKQDLNEDLEDYKYALEDQDYELAYEICLDLKDHYDNLGWAYDILDDSTAVGYYQKAEYYQNQCR